jgi:hypothetical protein
VDKVGDTCGLTQAGRSINHHRFDARSKREEGYGDYLAGPVSFGSPGCPNREKGTDQGIPPTSPMASTNQFPNWTNDHRHPTAAAEQMVAQVLPKGMFQAETASAPQVSV